jgi:deoxyribonuclease (pyrimidine dimer)
MTRVNLVPPSELADQHLFAEFREIKMVPKALRRSLQAAWQREFDKDDSNAASVRRERLALEKVLTSIPEDYCLGKGHVSFFYNKGAYLRERYWDIREELAKRNINFDVTSVFDPDKTFKTYSVLNGHYTPTPEALKLIRARITEKIAMKPDWYRWTNTAQVKP